MASDEDIRHFEEDGLLLLPGVVPEASVAPLRALAFDTLERIGRWRGGAWQGDPLPPFEGKVAKRVRQRLKGREELAPLVTPAIEDTISCLVGARPTRTMTRLPAVLFTPPTEGAWRVPHQVWHLDYPRLGAVGRPGVQLFVLLDRVEPRAGGTLVVTGSHRLLNDAGTIRSRDVRRRLRRLAYFEQLFRQGGGARAHLLEEASTELGVPLRVAELCGAPGDAWLTDLRVLHAPAPNATRHPRLMATQRFVLSDLEAQIEAAEAAPATGTGPSHPEA